MLIVYLRLMRPANIITALADILVGFAAVGSAKVFQGMPGSHWTGDLIPLGWLLLATAGLYGGGVVFNDVFDAELDAKERPERPIPSGAISKRRARALGTVLFLIGVVSAFQVSIFSCALAIGITLLCLSYDSKAKHHPFFGPLNMGACRGMNLLLGMSAAVTLDVSSPWFLALIPIVFIAAITMISRGEVHGGDKNVLRLAFGLYSIVVVSILALGFFDGYDVLYTIPFLLFFIFQVFRPLIGAIKEPKPDRIRKAVKAGVISLIIMDASIAAGYAGWGYGIVVLALLPVSIFLAKGFAVT